MHHNATPIFVPFSWDRLIHIMYPIQIHYTCALCELYGYKNAEFHTRLSALPASDRVLEPRASHLLTSATYSTSAPTVAPPHEQLANLIQGLTVRRKFINVRLVRRTLSNYWMEDAGSNKAVNITRYIMVQHLSAELQWVQWGRTNPS